MAKEGDVWCPTQLPAVPAPPVPAGVAVFGDQGSDPAVRVGPKCCSPGAVLSGTGEQQCSNPTSACSPSHSRSSPCWPFTLGSTKNNFSNIAEKPWDNFAEKHYLCLFFYGSVQCPAWHSVLLLHWVRVKLFVVFVHKLWRSSRPGWMELWATWSSGRCPCSWQGGWNQMIFKVPSNPNHSILWQGRTLGCWEYLGEPIKLTFLFHRPLVKLQKLLCP